MQHVVISEIKLI